MIANASCAGCRGFGAWVLCRFCGKIVYQKEDISKVIVKNHLKVIARCFYQGTKILSLSKKNKFNAGEIQVKYRCSSII
jgi:RecJ-like exonuclease